MGLADKLGWGKSKKKNEPSQTVVLPVSQSNSNKQTSALSAGGDDLKLVNYTPEQLMSQVQGRLSRVQFGWTRFTKFMENYGEWWAVLGPIILLAGTIFEVFEVLWTRQKQQDLITGLGIVAVSFALEGTFLAVSYKASAIRNRAERKVNGPEPLDKKKIQRQAIFWFGLAFGVAATQVMFVLSNTMIADAKTPNGIPIGALWTFAIVRSTLTLAGDAYTAFAHEEKPTTGEQATTELAEEGKISALLLKQTGDNVALINEQTVRLHAKQMTAEVELDNIKTESILKKAENQNRINTMRAQSEQAEMFTKLGTGIIRAMFDPDIDEASRNKILGSVSVFSEMAKQLPPAPSQKQLPSGDM